MTKPITHGGEDRRGKLCKCSVCGKTAVCSPYNDFYTKHKDPEGSLYCECCIIYNSSEEEETK